MKLFNDVNARQEEMLARLTMPPAIATSGPSTPTEGPESTPAEPVSGTKSLTINGTRYTDSADGELGKACGVDNNTCSEGYACALVTSKSGSCVPRN